jgi:hypothetical protein
MRLFVVSLALVGALSGAAYGGIYSGPTDTTNPIDGAIPSGSPLFTEWANNIDPTRTHFAPGGSTSITLTGFNSLGDLSAADIANGVSPGYITVTFPEPIRNGPGPDFAAFENGFTFGSPNGLFAELAYVEVSTNGVDFAEFPSISTNTAPVAGSGAFAGFDTTNMYNLAGKNALGFGTPFDLSQLANDPLVLTGKVDLQDINYVKLVDIPGNGSFLDSLGDPILDNWLTTGGTAGYDFKLGVGSGIGVLNEVPEPATAFLLVCGLMVLAGESRSRHSKARINRGILLRCGHKKEFERFACRAAGETPALHRACNSRRGC